MDQFDIVIRSEIIKMTPIVISLSFLTVLSVASADISHLKGYQYPKQAYNLGTGSLQLHSSSTKYATPYANGQVNLPNSYAPAPSGSPFESGTALSSSHQTLSLSPLLAPSTISGSQPVQGSLLNANYQNQASTQNYPQPARYQEVSQQHYEQVHDVTEQHYQQASYQTATQAGVHYNSIKSPQEPIVTKHFYVHAAPEEPEEDTGPRYIPVGQSQKTYKIIFIKAPNYSLKSQVIPVLPQNEEKTIVYVLSKKPEFDQTVHLPEPTLTEPSKPEVFFVKYKTQEEADRAQKQIQDAYNHASGDQSAVDLRGVLSNAEHTGSTVTLGGQDSTQQSQYAGVHYLSPDSNFA